MEEDLGLRLSQEEKFTDGLGDKNVCVGLV